MLFRSGSLATLEAVVEHYDHAGVDRPSRSDLMKPLGLSTQEKSELVAFLKTKEMPVTPIETPGLHTWLVWRDNLIHFAPLLFQQN